MSNEKILCSHELVIRFEQLEDNTVNWFVRADEQIENTRHVSLDELASAGVPLAALGVRALADLIHPNIIRAALDVGNMHLWKAFYLQLSEQVSADSPVIEGELGGGVEESVMVH